jgi:hypothetical protein
MSNLIRRAIDEFVERRRAAKGRGEKHAKEGNGKTGV